MIEILWKYDEKWDISNFSAIVKIFNVKSGLLATPSLYSQRNFTGSA